jgi:cobalt-precorrin-5B (C1)-methyltransferase
MPTLETYIGIEPDIVKVDDSMQLRELAEKGKYLSTLTHHSSMTAEVIISVPKGDEIAKKTLNRRLGILSGISILGTTGIVKPISSEAWCATISMGMNVAKAMGNDVIILSTGCTSEKGIQKILNPKSDPARTSLGFWGDVPIESFILMGDYLEFSLKEAGKRGFKVIHIASQWGKLIKSAMGIPQTHVRYGALEAKKAYEFISNLDNLDRDLRYCPIKELTTVREIYHHLMRMKRYDVIRLVCQKAKDYTKSLLKDEELFYHLISYEGEVVESV